MKYNNVGEYTSLKKSYRTIGELQGKPWNDAFKEAAVNAYWDAKENGMEFSSHAVARFLDRVKSEGYDSPMDRVTTMMKKGANYSQGADRVIRYYEELAIVTDRQNGDIVTFMNRKKPKKEWEEIK